VQLGPVRGREGHLGEDVGFCLVHQGCELGDDAPSASPGIVTSPRAQDHPSWLGGSFKSGGMLMIVRWSAMVFSRGMRAPRASLAAAAEQEGAVGIGSSAAYRILASFAGIPQDDAESEDEYDTPTT